MRHKISISREKAGLGSPEARMLIKRAVHAALRAEGVRQSCMLSVLLTDDEGICAINSEQRDIHSATDVLSFPQNELTAGEFSPEQMDREPETGRLLLGDMALSLERARAQGGEYGHGTRREIMYLTVHSVLHLLGYDHLDEGEMKRQMRKREKLVMRALGR